MSFWNDRIGWRVLVLHDEELIERPQRAQPAVDRANGMTDLLRMLDEGVDVLHLHFHARLTQPCEEQPQITAIMHGSAGVRRLAPQPTHERLDFW